MSFRIGTFNVRLGIADDGPNSWPHRRDLLANRILEADPDVLGVQEAYDFQMDFLAAALPTHEAIGVGREDGDRAGEFAGMFVRRSTIGVMDSGTFWLSETPEVPNSMSWGTACTRVCTWAHLSSASGKLQVLNAHLDHASAQARLEGMRLILHQASPKEAPTVLMGDFNAAPDDPPIQEILAAGYMDAMAGSSIGTWHDFTGTASDRIDYIFASPDLKIELAWVDERAGPEGRFPSDHFPVWVEFELADFRRNS